MALSPPAGYNANAKRPGVRFAVRYGANARSAGAGARKLLIVANKLAAGTKPTATPFFVPSLDDLRTYAGAGSGAFLQGQAVFGQYSQPNLWCVLVAENGSAVAATALLLFAGTVTTAGVLRVYVAGYGVSEISVLTTDTPTTLAAKVAAAVNVMTDWPVTAGASTGTVTLTAKQKGPRGNLITVRAELTSVGGTVALNGGSAGLTVSGKMGAGTATAGTGVDDIQAALDAVAPQKFDRIAVEAVDATNLGKLRTHLQNNADIYEGRRQHGVFGSVDDLSTTTATVVALNESRMQVGWHYNADDLPGEVAAALAAARLYGDGDLKGEESLISANLDTVRLKRLRVQTVVADRPTGAERDLALENGITTILESAASPGYGAIDRSVTTRSNDSAGNDNFAVLDTTKAVVPDFVADDLEVVVAAFLRGKNLADEPTNGRGPKNPETVFPSMVKAIVIEKLYEYERLGYIEAVNEPETRVQIERSTVNGGLLLGEIPIDVIEGAHNAAFTVSQEG